MPSTPEPTRSREERLADVYRRAGDHRRRRNQRLAGVGTAAAVVLVSAIAVAVVADDDPTTVVADRPASTSTTTTAVAPADEAAPPTTAEDEDAEAGDRSPPPTTTPPTTDPPSPTTTAPVDHGQALRDRTFRSVSVTEDGQPWALGDGTEIIVEFEGRSDGDVVRWRAGCNTAGASVTITADQLLVGEQSSTAAGCDETGSAQDEWMARFFDADPSWALDGTRLRLQSGSSVIELVEAPAGER